MFLQHSPAVLDRSQRMLQLAVSERRGSHHQRAIRNSICEIRKFLGAFENIVRVDRGLRLLISNVIRIHQPEPPESEIAHSSRGRADVQRIPRGN